MSKGITILSACVSFRDLDVPLPLSKVQIHLQYIVIVFFMTASIYDIVVWISESV